MYLKNKKLNCIGEGSKPSGDWVVASAEDEDVIEYLRLKKLLFGNKNDNGKRRRTAKVASMRAAGDGYFCKS